MKLNKLFGREKQNRRAPRANEFMLESLEPRLLLSATPMTAAVVTTDHLDYAPGETAVITTSNTVGDGAQFAAGELVRFQVNRTDGMADAAGTTANAGPAGNEAWYVIDGIGGFAAHQEFDANGQAVDRDGNGQADWIAPDNDLTVNSSISTSWFVEEQYRNSSLLVTAAGQESGAVAKQAFTDAAINTSIVVAPVAAATTVYGSRADFIATVTAAVGTVDPSGTVEFFADGVSLGSDTLGSGGAADGVIRFTTNGLIFNLTAGTHSINAVFTSSNPAAFNNSTSTNISQTITQKSLTGSFKANDKVYDGATSATVVTKLVGVEAVDLGNVDLTGGTATFATANVGANKVVTLVGASLTGSAAFNYTLASSIGTAQASITRAAATVTGYTGTYDGAAHAAATARGVLGESLSGLTLNLLSGATTHIDAGTYSDSFSYTFTDVTGNYLNVTIPQAVTTTTTIAKAVAAVNVSGFTGTYDAAAHGAAGSVIGVDAGGAALGSSLALGASFTNAPGGAANWSFTGGTNYTDQSGSVAIVINKAVAAVNVSGYTGTYDAAAHGATGTVIGVAGDLAATGSSLALGASFTNVTGGIANWSFTGGTNYTNQSGSVAITISKAVATVNVSGYTGTYDAAAHGASGTVTGVVGDLAATGSSLALGASFTNATGGIANWSFTGGTNYTNQSGSVAIAISKAVAAVNVSGFTGTYDAAAHGATGSVVGVDAGGAALGSSLALGASFTNAPGGTANWSFTGGANYTDQSGSVAIAISKAVATVNVLAYTGIYDAAAHGASGTVTGVVGDLAATGSSLNLGASFTNAPGGTATWTLTGGINYTNQSGSVAIVINKATVTITGNGLNGSGYFGTYDGTAHAATATVTGVGGAILGTVASSTTATNVGVVTHLVTYTDGTGNYNNASKSLKTFILQATVTITGAGLNGSGYSGTYDGAAHAATATVKGVVVGGVAEDLGQIASVVTHTNAGTYSDTVTFLGNANYKVASKVVTSIILKAGATITGNGQNGSGYFGTYDGTAHVATATVTGVGGVNLGTIVSSTTHTNAGTYSDTVTFVGDANYKVASKLVKSFILKATATITGNGLSGSGYSGTYDGVAHAATATVTGVVVGGVAENLGQLSSIATHTNTGTYSDVVTYTDLTGNYKNVSKTLTSAILQATVTLTGAGQNGSGYFGTYDGAAHVATATVTGVGGVNLGTIVSSTTHTNAGTYSDTVTFLGNANYKTASKVVKSFILQATATITVTGYNVVFDGAAHTATGTATGVNGEDLSAGLNMGGTTHTAKGVYLGETVTFTGGTNYKDVIRFVSSKIN